MLLALDTSTQTAGVALYHEGKLLEESGWRSEQNHTTELMPAVAAALQRQGVTPAALEGIGVALGPGSFSGLRVGMSVAKGLAYALSLPLVGIGTLETTAFQHSLVQAPLRPLLPAGRGLVYTALFWRSRGNWQRLEEDHLSDLDEVCGRTVRPTLFCGEFSPAAAELLRQRLGRLALAVSPVNSWRRAGFLAYLAWERIQAGQRDDPSSLEPIYLRRPSIGGILQ